MQQTKTTAIVNHLYPGVIITLGFIFFAPWAMRFGYPPQMGMLGAIVVVAMPLLLIHLKRASATEGHPSIFSLNGFTERLSLPRLILYSLGLVAFAFLMWGITQPVSQLVSRHLLFWLPDWYTVQDFEGYSSTAVKHTLVLNLVLNGILAPVVEELYFRGYLLPRMQAFGKSAFVVNALLFSLYHLWQPQVYLPVFLALLPMTYLVQRTRDLRLAIVTHCLLNLIGALLALGSL